MDDISNAWLALVGALFGGGGLKLIEYWLSKGKRKDDNATQIRKELREEVNSLRNELDKVTHELDAWKAKYYELLDQFYKIKKELMLTDIEKE